MAEEIARIIGYNNIPAKKINIKKNGNLTSSNNEDRIKHYLIDNGFYEVVNFPFTSNKDPKAIKVDNPLDSSKNFLRCDLKDSMLKKSL